jgi:hypothetical protein
MRQIIDSDGWNASASIDGHIAFNREWFDSHQLVVKWESLHLGKLGEYPIFPVGVQPLLTSRAENIPRNLPRTLEHSKLFYSGIIANANRIGNFAALSSAHLVDRCGQKMALLQVPVIQTQFAYSLRQSTPTLF